MTRKELYEKIQAHVPTCIKCTNATVCDQNKRCNEGDRLNRAYEQAELEHRDDPLEMTQLHDPNASAKCPDCGAELLTKRVRDSEYAADVLRHCAKDCGYLETGMAEDYAKADTAPTAEDLDMTQLMDPNEPGACRTCGTSLKKDTVLQHGRGILTAFICPRGCQ